MTLDRRMFYRRRMAAILVPVLMLCLGVAGPAGAQLCGDLNNSGNVDISDLTTMTDYLYISNTPFPAPLWVADMDGVSGITSNDYQTLVDNRYISFAPLNCTVAGDSSFQHSADTVEIRNLAVPAGASDWVVEVWLKAIDNYWDITIPFIYDCPTTPITLDSIVMASGAYPPFDPPSQRGLMTLMATGGTQPAGEQQLAFLYFSITVDGSPHEILIDTADYFPSHTTVLSRTGVGDRAVDGFIPVVVSEGSDFLCGDLDISGGVDISDLTTMTNYLYMAGAPFPAPLSAADMDGVPGVTSNDYQTLVDSRYLSHAPLDCSVTSDSSFQHSGDIVEVRHTAVPAGIGEWVVEVWLKSIDEYMDLTLAFSFDCATSAIVLDSTVRAGGGTMPTDNVGQRGLVSLIGGTSNPPGEQLVAWLHFSLTPAAFEQQIIIDTADFPPSHTTVLSRAGVGDRAVDGFVPMFVVVPEEGECLADGDVNNSGMLDIADAAALTSFVFLGGTAPDPLYKADVTGDCIIDSLDIVALTCVLFGGCDQPPVLPVATCCSPSVFSPGDTALALGSAGLAFQGDTIIVSLDSDDGSDGVRIYGNETQSRGISLELINADLSTPNAGLEFSFSGYVEGSEKMPQGSMQAMASVGIYNNGSGSLQVYGDFSPAGDPNVLVEVYYSGVGMTGSASIPGGGLIAFGNEYMGGGLPSVLSASFQTAAPPTFAAKLSVVTEFTLVGGPVLVGDSIRLVGANANAITHCSTFDLNGLHITFLGLINIKTNACCRGFTGNVDCDNVDVVDITDVQVMVDNLFLTLTPLCCQKEANFNYPGSGYPETDNITDITDLSILIDNQFLTLTPLPSCP